MRARGARLVAWLVFAGASTVTLYPCGEVGGMHCDGDPPTCADGVPASCWTMKGRLTEWEWVCPGEGAEGPT